MVERMPTPASRRWAMLLGLLAASATFACGQAESATNPAVGVAVGVCHVVCSDYSSSSYVAIAVSPSSLVCGSAANQATRNDAKRHAVAACGHPDCVPVVWGHDGVAALAVDQVAYGWGWAPQASSTADARAIASCESRTP
jgi:hypothetical protein